MDSNDFSQGPPAGTISGVTSHASMRPDVKAPMSKPASSALRSPMNYNPANPTQATHNLRSPGLQPASTQSPGAAGPAALEGIVLELANQVKGLQGLV